MNSGPVRVPKPAYIRKAQDFIATNVREPIGPDEIAAAAQVSERALYAGFKASLNTTPMRYLRQLRLDLVHATLLKVDPRRASVTEIALQWGFSDLAHFSRSFRTAFGETPRDYRKRLHKTALSENE